VKPHIGTDAGALYGRQPDAFAEVRAGQGSAAGAAVGGEQQIVGAKLEVLDVPGDRIDELGGDPEAAGLVVLRALASGCWPCGGLSDRSPVVTLPRTVADVLSDHVVFEVECIDRMYLNVWMPRLAAVGWPGSSSAIGATGTPPPH